MPSLNLLLSFALVPLLAHPVFTQSISSTTLAQHLLPASNATNLSSILGEQVDLNPFSLILLANETHVQATFNVSQPYDEVGWIAMGLGTQMGDSAMVILWPTENEESWIVSHRTAGGHAQPDFDPSVNASSPGRWSLVPSLTSRSTAKDYTIVTLIRTLRLPANQAIYPSSRTKYANLARAPGQRVIYAASSQRPPFDKEGSMGLQMHDSKMHGSIKMDLSQSFIKNQTATLGGGDTETDIINQVEDSNVSWGGWTKFDKIVAVHAAFAMLTWLLVAPTAVLIGRLGRKYGSWFKWHSRMQLFGTLPLTLIAASLGLAAAMNVGSATSLDSHKTLGIVLVLLTVFQLSLGQLSHLSHFTPSRSSTRPFVRVFHILLGVTIMPVAFTTIYLGIEEWEEHSTVAPHHALEIVWMVGVALFVAPYILSLFLLAIHRVKEGRSVYHSLFGLGRSVASPSTFRGREWARGLEELPSNFGSVRNSTIDAGGKHSPGMKRRSLSQSGSIEVMVTKGEVEKDKEWEEEIRNIATWNK